MPRVAGPPEERIITLESRGPLTLWITGDQLSPANGALRDADPATTIVLLVESLGRGAERPYHKRRLVLIYAAMRGYAADLRARGFTVDYRAEADDDATGFAAHVRAHAPRGVRMMRQTTYGLDASLREIAASHGLPVEIVPHTNFLSTGEEFDALFARGQRRVTMETFYRKMRVKTGLLMEGREPAGGAWNFDHDNRKRVPKGTTFPPPYVPQPSAFVREAIALVERHFPHHPGRIGVWDLPVTRAEALAFADDFFAHRLDGFGPFEDAMLTGELRLNHSRLSAAINIGLLHPLELCERAELAYGSGTARLASVEGFIRQLIGWREFIWQTYWRFMPEYRTRNTLGAHAPVPAHYLTGETDMFCQREALSHVLDYGWAHHIERLMILGNFGLLAGIEPQALTDWFWQMFVDGWDWVMVPNVIGMTLHADGGIVGTKPYAASANYIDSMSDYCSKCAYDPKKAVGEDACPYNALYWDFMARNERAFRANVRMAMPLRTWDAKPEEQRSAIRARAAHLRRALADGTRI